MSSRTEKPVLTEQQTTVHHAIIDLYELYDYEDITVLEIIDYTGLSYRQVLEAIDGLVLRGSAQVNAQFEVTMCYHLGYHPTSVQDNRTSTQP